MTKILWKKMNSIHWSQFIVTAHISKEQIARIKIWSQKQTVWQKSITSQPFKMSRNIFFWNTINSLVVKLKKKTMKKISFFPKLQ